MTTPVEHAQRLAAHVENLENTCSSLRTTNTNLRSMVHDGRAMLNTVTAERDALQVKLGEVFASRFVDSLRTDSDKRSMEAAASEMQTRLDTLLTRAAVCDKLEQRIPELESEVTKARTNAARALIDPIRNATVSSMLAILDCRVASLVAHHSTVVGAVHGLVPRPNKLPTAYVRPLEHKARLLDTMPDELCEHLASSTERTLFGLLSTYGSLTSNEEALSIFPAIVDEARHMVVSSMDERQANAIEDMLDQICDVVTTLKGGSKDKKLKSMLNAAGDALYGPEGPAESKGDIIYSFPVIASNIAEQVLKTISESMTRLIQHDQQYGKENSIASVNE